MLGEAGGRAVGQSERRGAAGVCVCVPVCVCRSTCVHLCRGALPSGSGGPSRGSASGSVTCRPRRVTTFVSPALSRLGPGEAAGVTWWRLQS